MIKCKCEPNIYQIRVQGKLDKSWSNWFNAMTIATESDITTLTGHVTDQAALRGVLCQLWDLNLALISVTRVESFDQAHSA